MAVLVLVLLTILVAAALSFSAADQRNATYQESAQTASSLAEAGVSDAGAVLSSAAVPGNTNNKALIPNASCQSSLLPSSEATAQATAYTAGTVKWWGDFETAADCQNWIWTLHAKATVANPTGGAAIVKRSTAQIQVHAPNPTSFQVAVWNTVYSPFGPTTGCDTSIGQGINIAVPVYVGGNLCMGQNAVITKPVYVGGYLFFQNKQGSIGTQAAPVSSAHVGGYCQVSSGVQVNPCMSEPVPSKSPNTNIWVNGAPANLTGPASDFANIAAPTICWGPNSCTGDPVGGWYSISSPGPRYPCTTSSGTPPTFESPGNTAWDDSVAGIFNLTPASSYTCQTKQGELSWNALTRTLTVSGTVFIDGSITMTTPGNLPITYTGSAGHQCTSTGDCQAVIFASGDISINSEKLCAVLNSNGTDCDWGSWNPNNKLLILASNGLTGITVGPSQTSFQGGLYATNTVSTGQSAVTEGPLVSGTKTVVLGQQFGGTFPPITILPLSIQEPPGDFWISPATNFTGG